MLWDLPQAFVSKFVVRPEDIDHYQHVNNAEYLRYIEETSWQHSNSLGMNFDDYVRLDRALVVMRHEIDYTAPAFVDEELAMATWIVNYDKKFRVARRFQLQRVSDNKTLMRAYTYFACVTLTTGRLKPLPEEFNQIYFPAVVADPNFKKLGK